MFRRPLTIFLLLAIAILLSSNVYGQEANAIARKFDEFGDIQISDLKARLDNFAIALQQEPNTKGFIIVYRTRNDLPGLSHSLALRSRNYVLENRSVTKDRLVTIDGGVAMCLTQELWVVPPGTAPKPRDDLRVGHLYNPDHAWKFFEYGFLPRELYGRFGVSKTAADDEDRLDAYVDEVKKSKDRLACLIVYAQYDPKPGLVDYAGDYEAKREIRLDAPGTARKRLQVEKNALMRMYGLSPSRIHLIDGGYRKHRAVELWIVPVGEPLPVPTPNSYPTRPRHSR